MKWREICNEEIGSFDDLIETASAGATGAANVATSIGAAQGSIGAGLDPNGHWGIYNSAKPKKKKKKGDSVLRR